MMTFPQLVMASGGSGSGPVPPLPPAPSRAQLATVRTTGMQGLSLRLDNGQLVRFTDGTLTSPELSKADRLRAYRTKLFNGDTHVILNVSWAYREGGLPWNPAGRDLSNDLPTLRQYLIEALTEGGMTGVLLMLAGDGSDSRKPNGEITPPGWTGPWGYNDPVGDTYGFPWLMANFQRIYDGIGADLHPYIVWSPGYDGVVPAWQPWSKVDDWLIYARSVVGQSAVLALELAAGFWTWSGERNDYGTPAGQCLDVILQEFPYPMGPPDHAIPPDFCNQPTDVRAPFDQVWQISKRLLGSHWNRPPDQPACDDPGHAPDLPQTPRGPFYPIAFEFDTYGWVRDCPLSQVQAHRDYLTAIGWSLTG